MRDAKCDCEVRLRSPTAKSDCETARRNTPGSTPGGSDCFQTRRWVVKFLPVVAIPNLNKNVDFFLLVTDVQVAKK